MLPITYINVKTSSYVVTIVTSSIRMSIRIRFALLVALHVFSPKNKNSAKSLLSPIDLERLEAWKDGDNQNIWELSGMFEGDMIQTPTSRNGLRNKTLNWPKGDIPYTFDDKIYTTEQRHWIESILKIFTEKTCIKPRPMTKSDKDYVYITATQKGCFSHVGKIGGKQILNLWPHPIGQGCLAQGVILHEFTHTIGFYHQQSASDRDKYVTVLMENIQKDKKGNFGKTSGNIVTSFGETYDYLSLMHYSAHAFTKNGMKTVVPTEKTATIGQKTNLSKIDIRKIKKMYNCT